jgi:SET domain-containing protein
MSYRPLPPFLTIKQSEIEGLGLFAIKDIPSNVFLGLTHVFNTNFEDKYIRTPLAGFYNHSENPNILSITTDQLLDLTVGTILSNETITELQNVNAYKYKYLVTIKNIEKGTELVSKYNLYIPNNQ